MLIGEVNNIHFDDCRNVLPILPDGCVDLLLQDTPFECTQNDWDIKPDLKEMWPLWNTATKDNGAMIFFATQPFASELINSNLKNFRYDLIWYKALGTGFLNANRMPMRNHEIILVFYRSLPTYNPQMSIGKMKQKGRRKTSESVNPNNYGKFKDVPMVVNDKYFPESVIDITNGDRTVENDHPTQKPIDIMRYLIRTYSNEGDLVFDGYVGSGTTADACIVENRNFIVCENKLEFYKMTVKRIEQRKSQTTLF